MNDFDPAQYGREWANDYNNMQAAIDIEIPATVKLLAGLARGGRILEVAAGTGRIAVPLAEKGLDVTATDASPEMLEKLKLRDTRGLVHTALDILPAISSPGQYSLIFIVLNSIWVMRSADEQQEFLRNAANHLLPHGKLVVEMAVTTPQDWSKTIHGKVGGIYITRTSGWNPVTQELIHQFRLTTSGGNRPEVRKVPLRIIFPKELLLMAEAEGFQARHVYSSWDGKPFDDNSENIIAIFEHR